MKIDALLNQFDNQQPITILPCANLFEAALLLTRRNIGVLVVVDQNNLLSGVVSERDLVRALARHRGAVTEQSVASVMTERVVTCSRQDLVCDVMAVMDEKAIRHVVVTEESDIQGVISLREIYRAYSRLKEEANTDELTGISNRRQFMRALKSEFGRYQRHGEIFSLAVLDLDHFKTVNDRYGHDVGDEVLRSIAQMLESQCRDIDCVGRIGGEEFAIVFPSTDLSSAVGACERLLERVRRLSFRTGPQTFQVTTSIGLTCVHSKCAQAEDMLKRADVLLYTAKRSGRDRLVAASELELTHTPKSEPRTQAVL